MTIFIIVGMPAAGKNIARDYAQSKGYPYYATGDLVRAEVKKRGLSADPQGMAAVSDELRGADGMGVTRLALKTALAEKGPVVFLEGMRSWPEIELIAKDSDCVVIAFLAPRGLRKDRIVSRGRSDDSADAFDARDQREIAYGTSIPIALADEYILNTGRVQDALDALDAAVKRRLA
ncbi:MAG TPA: AAA family ATPase [Deltaproteobacteria bacterium]|nr:AAA family ATPase [Deltaproteobacteria bacterium]